MTTREVPAGGTFRPVPVAVAGTAAALLRRGRRRPGPAPVPVVDPGAQLALTHQASRALLIGALAYRIVATLVPVIVLMSRYGPVRPAAVAATAAVLVGASAAALVLVSRRPAVDLAGVRRWILPDLALGFAANVLASWLAPAVAGEDYRDVFWFYLVSCVVLVTGGWGVGAGLGALGAAVPLQLVMDQLVSRYPVDLAGALGRLLWLAIGLVMAVVILALVVFGAGEAMRHGVRTGQAAERARILRRMHDTVLQALEAMALDSGADRTAPGEALAELRRAARAEALALRGALEELTGGRPGRLRDALATVAGTAVAHGVHADLVVADLDDTGLSPARVEALRDAVREALRNTGRHSGVGQAVVRVEPARGGVRVVVRDHGRGFVTAATVPGFGISQSIIARLAAVGGSASVESWPGRGTRVRLWVPA